MGVKNLSFIQTGQRLYRTGYPNGHFSIDSLQSQNGSIKNLPFIQTGQRPFKLGQEWVRIQECLQPLGREDEVCTASTVEGRGFGLPV